MATRMTENGVSTCRKAGSEQFEKFQTGIGRRKRTLVQYDYRASDGELFGRFIAFPSCRKSFISIFCLVSLSAYFSIFHVESAFHWIIRSLFLQNLYFRRKYNRLWIRIHL